MADKEQVANILNKYRSGIMTKSPKSLAIWQQNRTVMPGGVGSLFRLADPFPMVIKRASGARVWDADDNEYIDCMLGFSTMILGNDPQEVLDAIREALPRGTHYGQCHEHEYEFAKLFCDMLPGVDRVAFCNSGTEATMYALRLARATTGRPLIAKFEGGYHGTHDLLAVSFGREHPGELGGPIQDPAAIPESPGLAEGAWKDTIVLPFNHPAAFEKIRRHADQLAGVIIEPVQGAAGTIPADREFLSELRRLTLELGIFLIFDEVITGFRLAPGGARQFYGISPDVSTFGKVAGGGLPFGALGGSTEAMRWLEYDPGLEHSILLAGTFNGNPLVTAAGSAVLRRLKEEPQLYVKLNAMGGRLRDEINRFAREQDYPAICTGVASMFSLHAVRGPVNNVRDLYAGNRLAGAGLGLLYRLNGLHVSPSHAFLSTAHTDQDITRLIEIHKAAMQELRAQGVW